jgi:hypothetical protein
MSERLTFTSIADPEFVQDFLQSVLQMRVQALAMKSDEGHTWDLGMRIAFRGDVLPTIDQWIYDARAWLAAKGIACRKASAGGASMAHGCAAFSPAVGPAHEKSPEVAVTTPDDSLSLCPEGQFLPVAATTVDVQEAALEAASL